MRKQSQMLGSVAMMTPEFKRSNSDLMQQTKLLDEEKGSIGIAID